MTSNWKITSMTWSVQKALFSAGCPGQWDVLSNRSCGTGQLLPTASRTPGATLMFRRKWMPKQLVWCILAFFCFTVIFANTTLRAIVTGFII